MPRPHWDTCLSAPTATRACFPKSNTTRPGPAPPFSCGCSPPWSSFTPAGRPPPSRCSSPPPTRPCWMPTTPWARRARLSCLPSSAGSPPAAKRPAASPSSAPQWTCPPGPPHPTTRKNDIANSTYTIDLLKMDTAMDSDNYKQCAAFASQLTATITAIVAKNQKSV